MAHLRSNIDPRSLRHHNYPIHYYVLLLILSLSSCLPHPLASDNTRPLRWMSLVTMEAVM